MSNATTTYDMSWIMQRAWAEMRSRGRFERWVFARCLKAAWSSAKAKAQGATLYSEMSPAERELVGLKNKNFLSDRDHARIKELTATVAHEKAAPEYAEKRALIDRAGGRFCAVTFTKKDGSLRTMRVQTAALQGHVKGTEATESGRRASETRKARHPNLLPVWDAEKRAPRSINLATVSRIAVDGQVHTFA